MDEDDRKIRLLQEQFLPDGDLHSDSVGRMRRFRWNNIGKFVSNRRSLIYSIRSVQLPEMCGYHF